MASVSKRRRKACQQMLTRDIKNVPCHGFDALSGTSAPQGATRWLYASARRWLRGRLLWLLRQRTRFTAHQSICAVRDNLTRAGPEPSLQLSRLHSAANSR